MTIVSSSKESYATNPSAAQMEEGRVDKLVGEASFYSEEVKQRVGDKQQRFQTLLHQLNELNRSLQDKKQLHGQEQSRLQGRIFQIEQEEAGLTRQHVEMNAEIPRLKEAQGNATGIVRTIIWCSACQRGYYEFQRAEQSRAAHFANVAEMARRR
ncbi:MAG: hypothetical protein KGI80_02490 [Verrucomicrobiota bacterium]|nr:hypothetical protein [Verrucomicrobiota bacterium]